MRSPLSSISNILEMMQLGFDGPLTPDIRVSVDHLADDTRRLLRTSEALLRYLRVSETVPKPEQVDLPILLEAVRRHVGCTFSQELPASPPALWADRALVYETLALALEYLHAVNGDDSPLDVRGIVGDGTITLQLGDVMACSAAESHLARPTVKDERALWLFACRRGMVLLGGQFHGPRLLENRLGLTLELPLAKA